MRPLEHGPVGLGRPGLGRCDDAVKQWREREPVEHVVERHVPVAGHDEPQSPGPRRAQRRGGIGEGAEVQRGEQRLGERVRWDGSEVGQGRQRIAEDLGAAAAERGERAGVPSEPEVHPVEGDLRPERSCGLRLADRDTEAATELLAQARSGWGERDEGAESVEQQRPGGDARAAETKIHTGIMEEGRAGGRKSAAAKLRIHAGAEVRVIPPSSLAPGDVS